MTTQAVIAGIVATAMMTAVMFLAPLMGLPRMNVAEMLHGMVGIPVWLGWVMHFVIGIVFAVAYVQWFNFRLPIENDLVRGMVYGVLVFVFAQVMMMLMRAMGMGAEPGPEANMVMMAIGSFIGHLVFGLGLGLFIKREVAVP